MIFVRLENWLKTLTKEQLELIADGEEEERDKFLSEHSPCTKDQYCLASIFDDIWENL